MIWFPVANIDNRNLRQRKQKKRWYHWLNVAYPTEDRLRATVHPRHPVPLPATAADGPDENLVTAEFLDSAGGETTQSACTSPEPVLEPSDFVNMKGDEISFFTSRRLSLSRF